MIRICGFFFGVYILANFLENVETFLRKAIDLRFVDQ